MNIDQIQFFLSVAETRSIHKSAEQFHISQQGMNQSLANLEKEFHAKFLNKSNRGVQLTEDGEAFYQYAAKINATYQAALSHFGKEDSIPVTLSGELTIQALPRVSDIYLPSVLKAFVNTFPAVKLSVRSQDTTNTIYHQVLEEQCDIGICIFNDLDYDELLHDSNISFFEFSSQEIFNCVHRDYFDTIPDSMAYREVVKHPFINFKYETPYHGMENQLGYTHSTFEVFSVSNQKKMLEMKLGLAHITNSEFEKYYAKSKHFVLIPNEMPNSLHFVCLFRKTNQQMEAFFSILRKEFSVH